MVNFLGPGAFGCARPSAARPTFTADNAPGDVDDWAKDCSDPLARDGTEWRAPFLNFLIANFRELVAASGVPADNRDDAIFARAIQAGGMNYAVATGTANNWVVNPSLALKAYATGAVFWIKAPGTNTATTVTATFGTPGPVPVKKRDGSDPQSADLVSGCWYPTIFDGSVLCVVSPLPSERLAQRYLGFHGDPVSQPFATGAQAKIAAYTGTTNNLPGASYSAGIVTVGSDGFYAVTANMLALMPTTSGSYFYSIAVSKVDGSGNIIASVAALPVVVTNVVTNNLAGSASGIVKLAAGDRIAAFFRHNHPSSQNMSVSLDIEFRGA